MHLRGPRRTVALLVLASLLSGCYFGGSRPAKKVAYLANGVAFVAGAVAYTISDPTEEPCPGGGTCTSNDGELVGWALMVGGAIGIVINLLTPTRAAAPPQAPPAPVPSPAPAPAPATP